MTKGRAVNRKRMKDFLERDIGTRIVYSGAVVPLKKLLRYVEIIEQNFELIVGTKYVTNLDVVAKKSIESAVIYIFDEDVKKELFEIYNEGDEDIFERQR